MPDFSISSILDWLNSNGAVVSLCTAAFGFWGGLRTNMLTARRAEWNTVVDRVRAGLLQSRRYDNTDLRVEDADVDLLARQARWHIRGKISKVFTRHAEITGEYQRGASGGIVYSPEQIAEMKALREKLLELVRRR